MFEERLGEVNDNAIIGTYDYDLGLEIEEYDIPMDDYMFADERRKVFVLWVSEALDVKSNYKIVNEYKKLRIYDIKFLNRDKFVVFNYAYILRVYIRLGKDGFEAHE